MILELGYNEVGAGAQARKPSQGRLVRVKKTEALAPCAAVEISRGYLGVHLLPTCASDQEAEVALALVSGISWCASAQAATLYGCCTELR